VLPIGIVVNPSSGKDIRRLTAKASVFDNREKAAIVTRAVAGAIAAGATDIRYMDDSHGLAASAFDDLDIGTPVPCPRSATALDTLEAAANLKEMGCCAVMVLGGDGTNRAFVKGWQDAVLLPLSTGTNNVFPVFAEATVAGSVLGLLGAEKLDPIEVSHTTKIIYIEIEGEEPDVALIDAVITTDDFVGARALLDAEAIKVAVLTRAEPAAVGITSLGGLLQPVSDADEHGLVLELGDGKGAGKGAVKLKYAAPLAPGLYAEIKVKMVKQQPLDVSFSYSGPGILALDGERERVIGPGQKLTFRISRQGPRVLNIDKAMKLAACRGLFKR
jgi:predicted polyphosphate/ATP-dependent NAD kinase